ncbi:MAG: S46 family peptidase [Prevotellaceae bacterium]|nr:S46 family peptidase [Prevotellaceae bacterium]
MWMPGNLSKATRRSMKEMGLRLSASQLYHPKRPSLKDAVVSFGGFCTGVVVSEEGLVLTNHHCGLSSVQQHTSVEHNYLEEGFVATTRAEELPNPELYVRLLVQTREVTGRVLGAVRPWMSEQERSVAVDSVSRLIAQEASREDSTLVGIVDAFYGGNEFWLSVYRDYNDVRLVFAPPSSVGKFGWDTDNWMWPRHTGDFCLFRIYAGKENRPADYSPENVPYRPRYVVPLSTDGYRQGDFCMTLGYPGSTERFLSSFGMEEMRHHTLQARIDVRSVKLQILKEAMEKSERVRIQYASKYSESSNYWKNSIGMSRAIDKQQLIGKKQRLEAELRQWIRTAAERDSLLHLFTDLELAYKQRRAVHRALSYFMETFFYAAELPQLALQQLNFDSDADPASVQTNLQRIRRQYADFDVEVDKRLFTALLGEYRSQVGTDYLPDFYRTIDTLYAGDVRRYTDSLYARTRLSTPYGLDRIAARDSSFQIIDDAAVNVCLDLLALFFDLNGRIYAQNEAVERGERLFNAAVRRMYYQRNFYPDANMTMRLSLGSVQGYTPFDGAVYRYFTTAKGIVEKAKAHAGDADFQLQPHWMKLFTSHPNQPVCFLTNNDITGGNSGSPIFDGRGRLLGLAFDGNWEAMGSDLLYNAGLQRCIGVDVRYILFIMKHYGGTSDLLGELMPN